MALQNGTEEWRCRMALKNGAEEWRGRVLGAILRRAVLSAIPRSPRARPSLRRACSDSLKPRSRRAARSARQCQNARECPGGPGAARPRGRAGPFAGPGPSVASRGPCSAGITDTGPAPVAATARSVVLICQRQKNATYQCSFVDLRCVDQRGTSIRVGPRTLESGIAIGGAGVRVHRWLAKAPPAGFDSDPESSQALPCVRRRPRFLAASEQPACTQQSAATTERRCADAAIVGRLGLGLT